MTFPLNMATDCRCSVIINLTTSTYCLSSSPQLTHPWPPLTMELPLLAMSHVHEWVMPLWHTRGAPMQLVAWTLRTRQLTRHLLKCLMTPPSSGSSTEPQVGIHSTFIGASSTIAHMRMCIWLQTYSVNFFKGSKLRAFHVLLSLIFIIHMMLSIGQGGDYNKISGDYRNRDFYASEEQQSNHC